MVVLLATTPADAIRLPRWVSELLIVGVAAGLQVAAGNGREWAAGVVVGCGVLLAAARWWGGSPWWVAVGGWNPFLTAGAALAVRAV
jgi:hypothetical protein